MDERPPVDRQPSEEKPRPLPYQPAQPGVTRGAFRLLLLLTAINTMLLGWFVLGPQLHGFVREQWAAYQQRKADAQKAIADQQKAAADRAARVAFLPIQDAAMRYVAPDSIVYSDESIGERRIAGQAEAATKPIGVVWPGTIPPPAPFTALPSLLKGWGQLPTSESQLVFMHARTPPGGSQPALILVFASSSASKLLVVGKEFYPTRRFTALTLRPATADEDLYCTAWSSWEWDASVLARDGSLGDMMKAASVPLRMYAGQPDPIEPGRFTIRYDAGGTPGEIIGDVGRDGQVRLAPTGPMSAGWTQQSTR